MSYARLSRRPLLFKSFTGLAVSEFDGIVKEIESKYDEHRNRSILYFTYHITGNSIIISHFFLYLSCGVQPHRDNK